MTPTRFNHLNHVQTDPKPPSLMPVWYASILFVVLMAIGGRMIWLYTHPEAAKGVIQSIKTK